MEKYDLTKEEKSEIIISHLKTLAAAIYNAEVSLAEENSLENPSQDVLSQLNTQITNAETKTNVLVIKLQSLLG